MRTFPWKRVAATLKDFASRTGIWKDDQAEGLRWISRRLILEPGLLVADEVGLGKTRLAVAVMYAVQRAGGKVVAVVPPALFHQWETEYRAFRQAVGQPVGVDPTDTRIRRQMRSFLNLFPDETFGNGGNGTYYPLINEQPFLLVSHGFGLLRRLGESSQEYAWALPFMVRSFSEYGANNWSGCRGLKAPSQWDRRLRRQVGAAVWLAKRYGKHFRRQLERLPTLNESAGNAFSLSEEGSSELRRLFHEMLGRLLGCFDLVVIDEAHKSREDLEWEASDVVTTDDRPSPIKRLSRLIEEIVSISPESRRRRLALTATPIQMTADDWRSTLQRIRARDIDDRMSKIDFFEKVRERMKSGPSSATDVEQLCEAAKGFQDALSDVVVRRRWSDQEIMSRARRIIGGGNFAHPHRNWELTRIIWSDLPQNQRLAIMAAEGRSLSALGTSLDFVERQRAARHAQAMDVFDESEESDGSDATESGPERYLIDSQDITQRKRNAYWRMIQRRSLAQSARNSANPLLWHPRILASARWIETVTATTTSAMRSKVLVFGNYNKAIEALALALNLRQFLRELEAGRPTKPPAALKGRTPHRDSDLHAMLTDMLVRGELRAIADLTDRVRRCGHLYDQESDRLSRQLTSLLSSSSVPLDGGQVLRQWLRQVAMEHILETSDLTPTSGGEFVERLLTEIRLAPTEAAHEDETFGAGDALRDLVDAAKEERLTQGRRSDFARVMNGNTKPRTRRILQALFNEPLARPHVLVAQTRVASEGLNLHRACRHILFLHMDWNPALIEQQVGRIDRVGSLWVQQFVGKEWAHNNAPRIEIRTVVLSGTSDEERRRRILERQALLSAHLFGDILPPDVSAALPPEWRDLISAASPRFSPSPSVLGVKKASGEDFR